MVSNPKRSARLQLGIAIAHVSDVEHASAFETVAGHKARYQDTPLDQALAGLPSGKIGAKASPGYVIQH